MPDTILVTGSTGTIGSEVVRALDERGAHVRAAVHRRGKDGPARGRVETVEFDWARPETWSAGLSGADRVFVAMPLTETQPQQEAAFVSAARDAGVRHVVKLSVLGADTGKAGLLGRWHREGEQRIQGSGMEWTFLRPTFFMTNFVAYYPPQRDGNIYLPWGNAPVTLVAPADVGDVAAVALTTTTSAGKAYTLTGPEALTPEQIAETIGSVTGRAIRYVEVPEEAARQAMTSAGMPAWLVGVMLELHAMTRNGYAGTVTGDVRAVTGHEPLRFEDFAREHMRHPAWTPAPVARTP